MTTTPMPPLGTQPADLLPWQPSPQHGRQGSRARLAALAYLAHRPKGASTAAIADVLGLDEADTRLVLVALRADKRVASERVVDGKLNWYVPNTRDVLRRGKAGGA